MALTGTDRGTGTHNTGATSFTLSAASNLAAGSVAVLVVAADNAGGGGAAFSTFTATDTLGNTWTRRIMPLYDPGTASSGVTGAVFTTPMDGGTLQTSTTITVTFSASPVAKCWTLMEIVPGAGNVVEFVTGGVNTGSATASPTVTTGSIASSDMVIGALFNEQGTGQTVTGDADTTNGSWSTQQTAEVGSTAGGMTVSSQRKIVSATATQTYNPTLGTSSDVILGWIQLHEAAGATDVTPTAGSLTLVAAAPTVELGAVNVTPTAAVLTLNAAAPTIALGALDVTPIAAVVTLLAAAPTVEAGGDVTPVAASLQLLAASPTVQLGALDVTPTPAVLILSAASPTVQLGAFDVTPIAAALVMTAAAPAIALGAINVTPTAALVTMLAASPSATNGLDVTPTPASLTLAAATPTVQLGALNVIPTPAVLNLGAASPTLALGPIDVIPNAAGVVLLAAAPTVTDGVEVDPSGGTGLIVSEARSRATNTGNDSSTALISPATYPTATIIED